MEKIMSCNTLVGRYQFRIFFQMHYLFVLMGIFVLIINPYLTDTNAWFIGATDKGRHALTTYVRVPIQALPIKEDPRTGNLLKRRYAAGNILQEALLHAWRDRARWRAGGCLLHPG